MRQLLLEGDKSTLSRLNKIRPYPYSEKWLNSAYLCTVLPWAECGCARSKDAVTVWSGDDGEVEVEEEDHEDDECSGLIIHGVRV